MLTEKYGWTSEELVFYIRYKVLGNLQGWRIKEVKLGSNKKNGRHIFKYFQ